MSGKAARQPPRRERLLGGTVRRPPSSGAMARRRWMVALGKRTLPVLALALLGLIALWPELVHQADQARLIYRRGSVTPESGVLTAPRYRGEDDNRQPYTLTAATAHQRGPDQVDMMAPEGDIALTGGGWVHVRAQSGAYLQKSAQLDLSGEVTIYRDGFFRRAAGAGGGGGGGVAARGTADWTRGAEGEMGYGAGDARLRKKRKRRSLSSEGGTASK